MDAGTQQITPTLASEWLGRNTSNRPLVRRHVAKLAQSMTRGEWVPNGEAIKFSVSGALIDGQHRLSAIIQSGVTLDLLVIRGLPEEAFRTLDTGKPRAAADVLSISGFRHPSTLSAASRIVMSYERSGVVTAGFAGTTNTQILDFVMQTPALATSAAFAEETAVRRGLRLLGVAPGIAAATHYLFSRKAADDAAAFFDEAIFGEGLSAGDPTMALRNRLIEAKGSQASYGVAFKFGWFLRAWNAYRAGKPLKIVRMRSDDSLPAVA